MDKRIGHYITKQFSGEPYKAYIPKKLPPDPSLDMQYLYTYLEKAALAIAELNGVAKSIPNTKLFIYMYVHKEALLSSQIEGTQSSFSDLILFEHRQKPVISLEDVEEVSNYVKALNHGLKRMKDNFPLSLRLLKEIHTILLTSSRGKYDFPGEFRKSQNWIGGSKPTKALFVPPPPECIMECLYDLENFLHDDTLPVLIKAGLAHVQFETIHPFLDGNGRLGRLLIILLLCENKILEEPILYLSLYLKQNRGVYYDLMQQVRFYGRWEEWLEFFLEGIVHSSKIALNTIQEINKLFQEDKDKIESLGRARFSSIEVWQHLKQLPQVSVPYLSKELNMTAPTARSAVEHLAKLGIVEETSGKKKDKVYVYRKYLNILENGAEPLKRS